MAILGDPRAFPATLALLATALLSGCAAPAHWERDCVSGDLAERIGAGLGPELCPGDFTLPELADLSDGLSEDEAAAIGLWNNPGFQELLADLQIIAVLIPRTWDYYLMQLESSTGAIQE